MTEYEQRPLTGGKECVGSFLGIGKWRGKRKGPLLKRNFLDQRGGHAPAGGVHNDNLTHTGERCPEKKESRTCRNGRFHQKEGGEKSHNLDGCEKGKNKQEPRAP